MKEGSTLRKGDTIVMPKVFTTSQCLSGRCVFRLAVEALLISRELSNPANVLAEKQRANELLNKASRLLYEYKSIKGGNDEGGFNAS